MSTSNDGQAREQRDLEKKQADERSHLQEEQNRKTDAERKRLQEEADHAHTKSETAQKEALEKKSEEKVANAKLDH